MKILFLGLPLDRNSGVSIAQKNLADALRSQGVEVDQLTTYHGDIFEYHKNGELQSFNSLEGFLDQQEHYSLIHGHSWIWNSYMDDILTQQDAPFVYTFHSQLERKEDKQKLMVDHSDGLIFLTQAAYDNFQDHHEGSRHKSYIIPNAVPRASQRSLPVSQPRGQEPVQLLYVGRFSPEKGVKELAESFVDLAQEEDVYLTLVGKDSSSYAGGEDELRRILAPVSDRVNWAGWVPQEQVHDYQQQSHLQIIPSKRESFGLAGIEAVANGIPVAVTDIPTLREIYHLEEEALAVPIAPEGRPQDISQAVQQYLQDPEYWADRTEEAQAHFSRQYGPEVVGRQLLATYDELIASYQK